MENRESFRRPHENLHAWQDAMRLLEAIHESSTSLPDAERFGLTQIRRTAASNPSNVAEGAGRRSRQGYQRFLSMSRGSLPEMDTRSRIAMQLGFARDCPPLNQLANRVFAKLTALPNSLDQPALDQPHLISPRGAR